MPSKKRHHTSADETANDELFGASQSTSAAGEDPDVTVLKSYDESVKIANNFLSGFLGK